MKTSKFQAKIQHGSTARVVALVAGCTVVAVVLTALISRSLFGAAPGNSAPNFPKEKPQWDLVNKLEIPEKGLMVTRLISSDRCYIMPSRSSDQSRTQGRPLTLIDDTLSFEMVEHLAGHEAAAFCQGYSTYMLKEISAEDESRPKRESYQSQGAPPPPPPPPPPGAGASAAPAGGAGASAAPAPGAEASLSAAELAAKVPELTGPRVEGEGIFGGAALPGGPVANIPLDKRQPRCHKIVLDCPNMVGQVQSCFTWQNGRIWMDRQCKDPNTFVIRMTKPPGRILKVAQQETILCLKLHKEGKDC